MYHAHWNSIHFSRAKFSRLNEARIKSVGNELTLTLCLPLNHLFNPFIWQAYMSLDILSMTIF